MTLETVDTVRSGTETVVRKRWSIGMLSAEFDKTRQTVKRRIANVQPIGTDNGYAVYALLDVAPLLIDEKDLPLPIDEDGYVNPNKLPPREREMFFNSERHRLAAEEKAGNLVPIESVEEQLRVVVESVSRLLETLPDILERDAKLTHKQAELITHLCDRERNKLAEELTNGNT